MMFFFVISTVIAATPQATRLVCFAATAILKAQAAVIEVTAGGIVVDPTYMWSDAHGSMLANMTADAGGVLIASGDVKTGGGASVNDLATRFAASESTISSLQTLLQTTTTMVYADPNHQAWDGNTLYFVVRVAQVPCPTGSSPVTEAECTSLAAADSNVRGLPLGDYWKLQRMSNSYGTSNSNMPNEPAAITAPNRHPGCTQDSQSIAWTTGGNSAWATGSSTSGWTETWWKPVCKLTAPFTMRA